jgi:hypothetical protein
MISKGGNMRNILEALMICETFIIDKEERVSIINSFNRMNSLKFPITPSIWLFIRIRERAEANKLVIKGLDNVDKTEKLISEIDIRDIGDGGLNHFHRIDIGIPEPKEITFILYLDEQYLGETKLIIERTSIK